MGQMQRRKRKIREAAIRSIAFDKMALIARLAVCAGKITRQASPEQVAFTKPVACMFKE